MSAPRRFTAAEQAAAEAYEREQARHYARPSDRLRRGKSKASNYCRKCNGPHVYKHGRK